MNTELIAGAVAAASLCGTAAAGIALSRARHSARLAREATRLRDGELRDAHHRELQDARAGFAGQAAESAARATKLDDELRAALANATDDRRRVNSLRHQSALRLQRIQSLETQLAKLDDWDGKLWKSPVADDSPPFIPAHRRDTRFVSLLNLKGGVGKTTLTANLGASLAMRGKRVLLVDLDFQYSLTGLCLSLEERRNLLTSRATSARLLDPIDPAQLPTIIRDVRGLPADCVCRVIGADESLADAEHRAQGRWLVGLIGMEGRSPEIDARFLFRTVFHAPRFLRQYDFVFFDCPPRLTTACVNALSCSDFLLVPTLLDQLSVEAIPRTLEQLGKLAGVSSARLLGLVGNRAKFVNGNLIARHQNAFTQMERALLKTPFDGQTVHRATVKDSGTIADAANSGAIATTRGDGMDLFAGLTDLVLDRSHETPLTAIEVA